MMNQGAWQPNWHHGAGFGETYAEEEVESRAKEFAFRILLDMNWSSTGYKVSVTTQKAEEPIRRKFGKPVEVSSEQESE